MKLITARNRVRTWMAAAFALALWALPARAVPQEAPAPQAQAAQPAPAPVEQGKFILHKFEQPIGEETYQVTRDGDALNVKIDFKFTDRSTAVPLTAAF